MERPTPVTPPPDMRIRGVQRPDARRREEPEEEDARDILESVFIEEQTSGGERVSPVWVEIPPDDISLRAAQTLYPPPVPRKRFDENALLTALGVVMTLAAGVVLFFLARGPSRPAPTAAPPPASQVLPAPAVAPAPSDTAPLTSPVERNATATTLTVPPVVRDSPVAKAAAIETARLNAQAAARPSAPVAARPSAAAPASAPASAPATSVSPATSASPLSVRPAPEATIGSRLQPPVPELAVATTSVGSPAPAPAAPAIATPPVAVTPPVVAAPPVATTPPVAAPPAAANATAVPAATAASAAAAPSPAPRPAAPAGAPPSSPAELARSADEQGVRAVVERYRAAYSALDVNAVRAIWPRVNARALGRAFDQLSRQQLDFAGCEISVTGERASAGCSGNTEFVPKVGNKTPRLEARTWSFELRKSGAQWTIEAVESR